MKISRIRKYLDRIGANYSNVNSYEYLSFLFIRHLYSVPFENLDVYFKVSMDFNDDYFYREIVVLNSGGWCFELNRLFYLLLKSLGFKVTMIGGRVFKSGITLAPACSHILIMVWLDKPYLIDVGYGNGFRKPLPLDDDKEFYDGNEYFIIKYYNLTDTYKLFRIDKSDSCNKYRALYQFTIHPRKLEDFKEGYLLMHSDRRFNNNLMCNLNTPEGRLLIYNSKYKSVKNNIIRESIIMDKKEMLILMNEKFNISKRKCSTIMNSKLFREI